jgi:uncharacterized protein
MKTHVLYHANCPDGFASAYAAWCNLGSVDIIYQPVAYGRGLPANIQDGDRVYIVDFSYDRDTLNALHQRCELLVIDHHKTAQEALQGLPFVIFDMDKSGAVLTWEYFHRDPVPEILLYVQDRDLWTWTLPMSHEVNLGLWKGTPRTFEAWENLHSHWSSGGYLQVEARGKTLAFADQQTVALLCKHPATLRVGSWSVPAVNSPVLQSEIGHQLLTQCPHAPCAAAYCDNDRGERVFSLRSRKGDFDVATLAKAFGGGGHQAAAGFTIKAPDLSLCLPPTNPPA